MERLMQRTKPGPALDQELVSVSALSKTFRLGEARIDVLRGVNLAIQPGEFVAIEGRSGSGKSTLLHLMGLLDRPDSGKVVFEGTDVETMGASQRCAIRNRRVGFVFQFYHLLPELNVLQNTMLAAMVEKSVIGFLSSRGSVRERAEAMLDSVGLKERMKHRPSQLSGGERQRVAIARALMNEPKLLLADEPTGNLDSETGRRIMDVIERIHAERNLTVVMVTHDRSLAREADRVLVLKDGLLSATS
jgi:lipoprotein-releasing system ATP-binding protein